MDQIGILLPRSSYYQTIGFDMFEGLRSGLKQLGRDDVKIFSENIGFGTDHQNCYRIAERLLLQENLAVMFAFISHRTAQLIRPLFMGTNTILVVLDSGANMPQEWPESPNVLLHSLHNSLGSWLSARKSANDGHRKASMITGYYDGGYLHTYASNLGLTAEKSEVVFNLATGYKREDFSLDPLKKFREDEPDNALVSIFSGDFVQWFFEELNMHFGDEQPAVYLSPFSFEEMTLKDAPYPGNNVSGIAAWSETLEHKENKAFVEAMKQTGRNANLFAVLGWEAATLAVHLLEAMRNNKNNGREALKSLKDLRFTGPRGEIRMHRGSQTTLAPLYEANIVPAGEGKSGVEITAEVNPDLVESIYAEMVAAPLENATSGWHNSYTCI